MAGIMIDIENLLRKFCIASIDTSYTLSVEESKMCNYIINTLKTITISENTKYECLDGHCVDELIFTYKYDTIKIRHTFFNSLNLYDLPNFDYILKDWVEYTLDLKIKYLFIIQ